MKLKRNKIMVESQMKFTSIKVINVEQIKRSCFCIMNHKASINGSQLGNKFDLFKKANTVFNGVSLGYETYSTENAGRVEGDDYSQNPLELLGI